MGHAKRVIPRTSDIAMAIIEKLRKEQHEQIHKISHTH